MIYFDGTKANLAVLSEPLVVFKSHNFFKAVRPIQITFFDRKIFFIFHRRLPSLLLGQFHKARNSYFK